MQHLLVQVAPQGRVVVPEAKVQKVLEALHWHLRVLLHTTLLCSSKKKQNTRREEKRGQFERKPDCRALCYIVSFHNVMETVFEHVKHWRTSL
jgi:hypothetical protein